MATPTAMPAGWYADPAHRHEYRYWDGANWTALVSDGGVTASDSLESPPTPAPAGPPLPPQGLAERPSPATPASLRRRRRVMWIALATAVAAFVIIGGFGLSDALKTADTYQADLTTGHGDFPAITSGNTATSYQPDGFHLRIGQAGGFRPTGVTTPRSYIAAEVTATVTQLSSPAGAGFGPWCFYDINNGYGMDLASDGQVTITYLKQGNPTVVGEGTAAVWRPGQTRKLTIVCRLTDTGDRVSAFVNGAKAADIAQPPSLREIKATGFAGFLPAPSPGPGEWTVTSFSRVNPLS